MVTLEKAALSWNLEEKKVLAGRGSSITEVLR